VNIILLGPPGVGKGTQSQRLAKELRIPVIATGDMFRTLREEDTPLARQIKQYMDRGEYVPDELTIDLVLQRLQKPDAQHGFILDGFPRTVAQARALDEALASKGEHTDYVILMTAPKEVVLQRLAGRRQCQSCGWVYNTESNPSQTPGICDHCGGKIVQRTDETPEIQKHRLEVYEERTKPVIEYYRKDGRLTEIDATAPVDEVTRQLKQLLVGATSA
jgi:adenylate kinase